MLENCYLQHERSLASSTKTSVHYNSHPLFSSVIKFVSEGKMSFFLRSRGFASFFGGNEMPPSHATWATNSASWSWPRDVKNETNWKWKERAKLELGYRIADKTLFCWINWVFVSLFVCCCCCCCFFSCKLRTFYSEEVNSCAGSLRKRIKMKKENEMWEKVNHVIVWWPVPCLHLPKQRSKEQLHHCPLSWAEQCVYNKVQQQTNRDKISIAILMLLTKTPAKTLRFASHIFALQIQLAFFGEL